MRTQQPSIKIVWEENDSAYSNEYIRSDVGLSEQVQGGKLRFTHRGNGEWAISFVKRDSHTALTAPAAPRG